jgi:3-deoxy-7-phosphoheptulonate synthase
MQLPSPSTLKTNLPITQKVLQAVEHHRKEISHLIHGVDPRFVIIAGPCSLHSLDSALLYANKLYFLQKKVEKSCKLVMRAHIEKPRTHLGWKGILHDPSLNGKADIEQGLTLSRTILLELAKTGIALASEFLDPIAACYFSDLISWGFIGARTATSQIHRQLASHLPMPVGFKNPTDGNVEDALHAVLSAHNSHSLLQIDEDGQACAAQSSGNPFTHIVLRGALNHTNYEMPYIQAAVDLCHKHNLFYRILVDCAHGNSQKNPSSQKGVLFSVLEQYLTAPSHLLGVMIESHLEEGKQPISSSSHSPFLSVTDPCIGWEQTEELILSVHETLSASAGHL